MADRPMSREEALVAEWEAMPRRSAWQRWAVLARRKPLGAVSLLVITVLVIVAIFADVIAPYDPIETNVIERLQKPSASHLLGTDQLGRDILSRIIKGARISLYAGFVATAAGTLGGALLGIISAYVGGKLDMFIQRVADAIMTIPGLILLMVLTNVLGNSLINIVWALSIYVWPFANRVVRGAALSIKENQYIEAAQTIGASNSRIIGRYILPNVMATIIVIASVTIGNVILIEASLSFLGLSVAPPEPTWGNMLSYEGRQYMETAPWLAWFPGLAITITVLAWNLLGDALRDIWDPRLRGTG